MTQYDVGEEYTVTDSWLSLCVCTAHCVVGHTVSVLLQPRAVNVDLQTDAMLQVDISDALSERDKVKFTVHTKVRLTAVRYADRPEPAHC